MVLLVMSDSHGKAENIQKAYDRNTNASEILFLGDGLRDMDRTDFGVKVPVCVSGNCDFFGFSRLNIPEERVLTFGEYTVLMMHGHNCFVKSNIENAARYASAKGADILLFGHTHMKLDMFIPAGETVGEIVLQKPLRIFNPGSIGMPREGRPSFGVITFRGRDVLMSHGEI